MTVTPLVPGCLYKLAAGKYLFFSQTLMELCPVVNPELIHSDFGWVTIDPVTKVVTLHKRTELNTDLIMSKELPA